MDAHLIYQLNQAVDRGDKRVKRDLLAKADQVKRFIEALSQEDPRLIKLLRLAPPAFKEAVWIAYLVRVLGLYLNRMKGKKTASLGAGLVSKSPRLAYGGQS
jgi:hypothetical protein